MNWEDLEAKSSQFMVFPNQIFAKSVNWEENRELGVVRLHIFNSRISNSRKIPGPKKRELGGHTVFSFSFFLFPHKISLGVTLYSFSVCCVHIFIFPSKITFSSKS